MRRRLSSVSPAARALTEQLWSPRTVLSEAIAPSAALPAASSDMASALRTLAAPETTPDGPSSLQPRNSSVASMRFVSLLYSAVARSKALTKRRVSWSRACARSETCSRKATASGVCSKRGTRERAPSRPYRSSSQQCAETRAGPCRDPGGGAVDMANALARLSTK
eukprot:Amastigsp_a513074_51.p2 type:complete len:166 gc:universal Amastigsp_a513074_51:527-30(-)